MSSSPCGRLNALSNASFSGFQGAGVMGAGHPVVGALSLLIVHKVLYPKPFHSTGRERALHKGALNHVILVRNKAGLLP